MVESLQSLCQVPAVIAITFEPCIKDQIFSSSTSSLNSPSEYKAWNDALLKVVSKVLKCYSVVIRRAISEHFIPLIGIQMLKWAKYLQSNFDMNLKFIRDFIKISFFTWDGTFDERKATEDLLKTFQFEIFITFRIACHFFLFKIISSLYFNHKQSLKKYFCRCDSESPEGIWLEVLERAKVVEKSPFIYTSISDQFTDKVFDYGTKKLNISAVKMCFSKNIPKNVNDVKPKSRESKEEKISDNFDTSLHPCRKFFDNYNFSIELVLSNEFLVHRDSVMNVCTLLGKRYIVSFFHVYHLDYTLLKCLLIWPNQNIFLKTAVSSFSVLNEQYFYRLMQDIFHLAEEPNLRQTYNYKLLLKQFWIKSPSKFKTYVINVESQEEMFDFHIIKPLMSEEVYCQQGFLLPKLILRSSFSQIDKQTFLLILESATSQDKEMILQTQGFELVAQLLYFEKFEVADLHINSLTVNGETRELFIKEQAVRYFSYRVIKESSLDMVNRFLDWAATPDQRDKLKEFIFSNTFMQKEFLHSNKFSLSQLNVLLKWFSKTDEEIEEWKKSDVFEEYILFCKDNL